MVLYDFDSNYILATCIKSRKKEHRIEEFKEVQKDLTDAGIVPQLVKLDNEASSEMIKTIKKKNMSFQLARQETIKPTQWNDPSEPSRFISLQLYSVLMTSIHT